MTHDIYFVKTRTNKQKQTDVLLYVNDGCGLNNCYSNKSNKQLMCFKGKEASTKLESDRIGPDRTGLDHGSDHGSDHRK